MYIRYKINVSSYIHQHTVYLCAEFLCSEVLKHKIFCMLVFIAKGTKFCSVKEGEKIKGRTQSTAGIFVIAGRVSLVIAIVNIIA